MGLCVGCGCGCGGGGGESLEEDGVVVSTLRMIKIGLENVPDDKHDLSMPVDDILHVQMFKSPVKLTTDSSRFPNPRPRCSKHMTVRTSHSL